MHKLRRFYYQNKEKIWKVILIIVLILALIYFLSKTAVNRNNQKISNISVNSKIYSDEENRTYISEQSAISGEAITEKQVTKINNTISKFLQYCKNGNVQEAYNMLSENCKKDRYSSAEKFNELYVKSKFNKLQVYDIQNWISNTYRVSISNDLLATGNIQDSQKQIEYITITNENGEDKLNIHGYIGKRGINKEILENDIRIKVIDKQIYMDYEIYNIEIENLSKKIIMLDSLENTGTIYLKDNSGNKYNARMHEILEEEITIKPKHVENVSIKFTKTYSPSKNIKSIIFENLILDYNEYKKQGTNEESEYICEITINL